MNFNHSLEKWNHGRHYYLVSIIDSDEKRFSDFEGTLIDYLERKKETIRVGKIKCDDGAINYSLRNGLYVKLRMDTNDNGHKILEMRVSGDVNIFNKSIAAISRVYSGRFMVAYLN